MLLGLGVRLLQERGLEGGAAHITLNEVFARASSDHGVRVTPASVYGRIWDTQADFQRELLLAAAAFYPDGEERPTLDAARRVIAAAELRTPEGRWEALREVCRVAGEVHIAVLEASRAWQIWVGVWALTVSTPTTDDDRELGPSILAGHEAATAALASVLREILAALGFRLVPSFTIDQLALAIGATAEGLALRDRFASSHVRALMRPGRIGQQPWTLFGIVMEGTVSQFVEPIPDWEPARLPSPIVSDTSRPKRPVVVVVGSLNQDIVVRADRIPGPGETILGAGVAMFAGGKGANQAVAAARAGVDVRMIGRVGSDDAGRSLLDGLRRDRVEVRHVGTCEHDPTGTALITVAANGENSIVVVPGANARVRPEHVDDAIEGGVFVGAAVVLAERECPADVVERAFRAAREAGVRTILNVAPADGFDRSLLALVDVVVVNEHELAMITGGPDADVGMKDLAARVPTVVVTLGASGVALAGVVSGRIRAHRVDVVDTTGAGDAFCGAFAAALACGADVMSAARRGNAAGALATTKAGAQASLPTAAEVDALLATLAAE